MFIFKKKTIIPPPKKKKRILEGLYITGGICHVMYWTVALYIIKINILASKIVN